MLFLATRRSGSRSRGGSLSSGCSGSLSLLGLLGSARLADLLDLLRRLGLTSFLASLPLGSQALHGKTLELLHEALRHHVGGDVVQASVHLALAVKDNVVLQVRVTLLHTLRRGVGNVEPNLVLRHALDERKRNASLVEEANPIAGDLRGPTKLRLHQ